MAVPPGLHHWSMIHVRKLEAKSRLLWPTVLESLYHGRRAAESN